MNTKIKSVEECTSVLEIDVPVKDIEKVFNEVYAEMTKYANIPGFRVGKAPKELVKQHYGKNAKEEALKRLVPDAYRNALVEHNISPIGMPEISDVLELRYFDRSTKQMVSNMKMNYDKQTLEEWLRYAMKYWSGEREAQPVSEAEKWKCNICRFFGKECTVWYKK